jgi:hypothetical protein
VNGLDPPFSSARAARPATNACPARNFVIVEMSDILHDRWLLIVSNLPLATKLLFFNPSFIQLGLMEVIAVSDLETMQSRKEPYDNDKHAAD